MRNWMPVASITLPISPPRALKAANLSDDAAAEVVEAIEEYIAVKVQEANKGIESKLTAQTWVIGSVGFVLAVIGLAPAFIKLFQ